MIEIAVAIAFIAALALGVRIALKRAARQRAEHDARLRAMAQTYLSAMKKKQAAEAAAAAKAAATTPDVAPSPTVPRDERECPFCAELILRKARVCKHCGRDVEPSA